MFSITFLDYLQISDFLGILEVIFNITTRAGPLSCQLVGYYYYSRYSTYSGCYLCYFDNYLNLFYFAHLAEATNQ